MDSIATRKLNDAELEAITGGMDCQTAIAVSWAYTACAIIYGALGDIGSRDWFQGRAQGVRQGGCG